MSETTQTQPAVDDRDSPSLPRWWWVAVFVLVVLRMVMVADDEIIPQVFDSTYYAQAAAHYFSSDPFSMLPTHRPGISILAWLSAEMGVPYKMSLDLLLVIATIFAGTTLHKLTRSRFLALAVIPVFLFHPWFFVHSQLFMTEPLVSVLLLLMFLTSIQLICRPFHAWSASTATIGTFAATFYVLARNEFLVLLGFCFLILVVVLIRQRGELGRKTLRQPGGWRLVFLLLPVAASFLAMQAVKQFNLGQFGVRAMCATEADGFCDLINALYSVNPQQPLRYIPVPRKTLMDVCAESPVMKMFETELLDEDRPSYMFAQKRFGFEGEVATWLNWHLIDCFGGVDRNSNRQMRVAAHEIRMALDRGDLPKRFSRFPLDPVWREWLPQLPSECIRALRHSFADLNLQYFENFLRRKVENSVEVGFFDTGLLRRSGTGFSRSLAVFGKSLGLETQATTAQLLTPDLEIIMEVPVIRGNDGYAEFNFFLDDSKSNYIRKPVLVRLVRVNESSSFSATVLVKGLSRLKRNYFEFDGQSGPEEWNLSFDRHPHKNKIRRGVRKFLVDQLWIGMVLLLVLAFVFGAKGRISGQLIRNLAWIGTIGFSLVFARCLMYALIDVWLSWGIGRYVEPNVFVMLFSLICFAIVAGNSCSKIFLKRSVSNGPAETPVRE